jgi:tetratricopeptide (TPR) repeat protein
MTDTGSFSEVTDFEKQFNASLPKYSKSISNVLIRMINYHIARCYFGVGKYDESIKRFSQIINEPKSEQETAVYGFSMIWIMLSHFELKNYNILPYLSKSAARYFKKHKILFAAEKHLFDFFAQNKNFVDEHRIKSELKQLKRFFNKHINPAEDKQMIYTSLSEWIECKLSNRTLQDLLQEKVRMK